MTLMPFKSKAQVRKFHSMVKSGRLDPEVLEEWEEATPSLSRLPERVKRKNEREKSRASKKRKKD